MAGTHMAEGGPACMRGAAADSNEGSKEGELQMKSGPRGGAPRRAQRMSAMSLLGREGADALVRLQEAEV